MTEKQILELRKRIYDNASKENKVKLEEEDNYGAPADFWDLAERLDLITTEEYWSVRDFYENKPYKNAWIYRGD